MYNNKDTILSAIRSVQIQEPAYDGTPYEIVHYIGDDCSTDGSDDIVTEEITKHLKPRLEKMVLRTYSKNQGQAACRNDLLDAARDDGCDIVAFLDADDEWYSGHLKAAVSEIDDGTVVYSTPAFYQEGQKCFKVNIPTPKFFIGKQLEHNNFIWISSVVIPLNLLRPPHSLTAGNPMYNELFDSELNSVEDWDMWYRLFKKGVKFSLVEGWEPTVKYNVNPDGEAGKSQTASIKLREKHGFKMFSGTNLNIACGQNYLQDYINADLYPTDKVIVDAKFDAKLIPYEDNSVDILRALHVIEHFHFYDGQKVLKEWNRVLKPGGMLLIETPDMLGSCKAFVDGDAELRNKLLGHFFAFPWEPGMTHYFLFTEDQMRAQLGWAGFGRMERIAPMSNYIIPGLEYIHLAMRAWK